MIDLILSCTSVCASRGLAWLLFEHIRTIDREVQLFWRRPVTGATALFIANRYMSLLSAAWWIPWTTGVLDFRVSLLTI